MTINTNQISSYTMNFVETMADYLPKLLTAFIVLILGLFAIRIIKKIVKSLMYKRDLDPTLSTFLADIIIWALKILLLVTFISKLGIETTSFVAIVGAAGLAIGLALQGSLSNFAGGVLLVLFKPFEVGDVIESQGVIGTVSEIQIFVTKVINANNQTIFIPNGILSNGIISNYSIGGTRRSDISLIVSYSADLKKVKEIILNLLNNDSRILNDPEPSIKVAALLENGVSISIRSWCANEDYSKVHSDALENIKLDLDKAGIIFHKV
jgi:small conductance mechanosensitive channel